MSNIEKFCDIWCLCLYHSHLFWSCFRLSPPYRSLFEKSVPRGRGSGQIYRNSLWWNHNRQWLFYWWCYRLGSRFFAFLKTEIKFWDQKNLKLKIIKKEVFFWKNLEILFLIGLWSKKDIPFDNEKKKKTITFFVQI